MSTDLFFAPPAPQNPSRGIQRSTQTGSADPNQSGQAHTDHTTSEPEPETFLNTLKKVSGKGHRGNPKAEIGGERPAPENSNAGPADLSEDIRIMDVGSEDVNLPVGREAVPAATDSDPAITAFMVALAELGIQHQVDESGFSVATDLNLADPGQLAAVKSRIARLGQNPAALTAGLKTVVDQIQQAIAPTLTDGAPGDGFVKEIAGGMTGPKATGGAGDGIPASGSNVPEPALTGHQAGIETVLKSSDIKIGPSNLENQRPDGDSANPFASDGRREGEPTQTEVKTHPSRSAGGPAPETAKTIASVASDSSTTDKAPRPTPDQPIPRAENEIGEMAADRQRPDENAEDSVQRSPLSRLSAGSDRNPARSRASEVQPHNTTGEEPVSKLFQETQPTRAGASRAEIDLNEEPVGKIVKSEAGSGDSGPLNSSGQNAEKSSEAAAPVKDAAVGQEMSRNQTLDQIVRRAAIHLRNGQHEARIDLKPDFLGHVRMQVISESHQVTVKILAEHGFVKDMIENNLHQLKADLQQQGLEVDKVEVSVSQNSQDGRRSRQQLGQSKFKQGSADHQAEDHAPVEHGDASRPAPRSADSHAIVDYFA